MKRTAFGTSDLPDKFRLENYQVCATWGVKDWWQALVYRHMPYLYLNLSPDDYAKEGIDREEASDMWADWILEIFDDPMPDLGDGDRLYPAEFSRNAIRDLTGSDFFEGFYKLNDEGYATSSELAKKVARRTGIMEAGDLQQNKTEIDALRAIADLDRMPAWQIHRDAYAVGNRFRIDVDLGAADEDLVKEFKRWLKRIRKDAEIPQVSKRFDQRNFIDWHEKRLLPCLDLLLWAQANGGSITLPVLGNVLFPDEHGRDHVRGVEAMIRRTTIPQARMLANWHLVKALYRQMRDES